MRKFAGVLVERFGLVVVAGAVATLVHHYGGLNIQASILLGFAFTVAGLWLYGFNQVLTFKPYRLVIGIRYAALWEDLQLTLFKLELVLKTAEGRRYRMAHAS